MKIAVIGSGVSGLAATWLLNEHSDHEVHLYEADSRPGGHANTVKFFPPRRHNAEGVDVDTGFIVLNPSTYPNFLRFLKRYPKITILPTEMTFSVSRDRGLFEWAGNNLLTVFCQPSRLLDPNMWRLLYDVMRFNACSRRLVMGKMPEDELSIGEYLQLEGYSNSFRDNYLIVSEFYYDLASPMTAAIWSTPPDKCTMDFPARTLIRFLNNHHLLQITGKPSWLTIKGGSRNYVEAILARLPEGRLHLSTAVKSLSTALLDSSKTNSPIVLETLDGKTTMYDRVIVACHSDTALSILKAGEGLTEVEDRILSRFSWSQNEAVLHADPKLMPTRRLAWACWNYLSFSTHDERGRLKANIDKVALTYNMNDLQHLSEEEYGPVLVTLNPPMEPDEDKVASRFSYDHPVLNSQALRSQKEMDSIQGSRGILYAGAWLGYGFHEDGFTSGLRAVSEHIDGVHMPFDIVNPDREPRAVLIAHFFDFFESTGVRVAMGTFLSFWLSLVRTLFL
ncbi:FAD/NAD(P)-binding domain-containing protein [Leucogyrophana mollusca]|uniref:FAD/NAD(P)-binding domain-containing protein n=1 Tax=Leucogyrophana mollusca TaxID=85980 RepID=A0ACB8BET5_9AGAM|nr:FAD/NAD(P)-binding domain-containing protein [Leucogyrophana mollusca]